jgi:gluconokinase
MARRALALDLGSSSVRALVFEAPGTTGELRMVEGALARRARRVTADVSGQAVFDVDGYLADLVACIDELHSAGQLDGVSDVGLACQWHSIVALGSSGQPLGDAVAWADTRACRPAGLPVPGPAELEQLRQRTGCALHPMYWTSRAPWLARELSAARFVGLSEYVGLQLLGDPCMSVSMASGTGLLATQAAAWDEGALELAGTSQAALPPLASRDWRGRLDRDWRRRWPVLAEAVWHPALGDGAAANLGAGWGPSCAVVTVGTSAAVRTVRPAPGTARLAVLPEGLWRYRVDHDQVVLGAAYSSGGQLYSWALSLWEGRAGAGPRPGGDDGVDYDVEAPVPAGSEGVLVMPWHAGTRPPAVPVPAGRGCIVGLGLGHSGAHIVSAAVEAVCFQVAGGLDDLEAGGEGPLEVVANGGAVECSALWRQRLAATLGRPVLCSTARESTARGAALAALGATPGRQDRPGPTNEVVAPTEADMAALADARRRWSECYVGMLPIAQSTA